MLRLLIGKDWKANQDVVLQRIAEDVHACKEGRILIVPELISHETERALCAAAGDTASRYAEVISFSRLARRAVETAGAAAQECLDNGGRVVAMAASARQLSSKLKAYAAVETRPEFLTGLIDAIDEFKRCCITSADLKAAAEATEGGFSQKLEELSLLMETYDTICSRGKRDPRDQMTWLLEKLEEGTYAQEHVFYIEGFPDFTRQNLAIIEHLIKVSPCVTVSLNCDELDSNKLAYEKAGKTAGQIYRIAKKAGVPVEMELVPETVNALSNVRSKLFQGSIREGESKTCLQVSSFSTPWAEVMAAAQMVKKYVMGGARYRDITVVCGDMSTYLPIMNLVFHRMRIPLYQAGTEDILQKSMIHTVLTALDAALTDFDQRNMLRYLRSALSGVDSATCDLLENYAFIWGIRGQRWLNPWVNHPDGLSGVQDAQSDERLAYLNTVREAVVKPLEHLRKGIRSASNLREQVEVLYVFLEEIHLEKHLETLAEEMNTEGDNRNAQILNQLWEILISALEQMYDVLGETVWEPEYFTRLLRLLLSQYDVGTIPPVLDAVQMGPVTAMRCHRHRHLIVLGAQEGNLPSYSGSNGVLTDMERVMLRSLGVPLTGGAMEGIQEEFAEIYGVFCGACESVFVSCSGDQPSFVYRRLAELVGGETTLDTSMGFAWADSAEAGAWLASRECAMEAEALGLTDSYVDTERKARYSLGSVASENIHKLYGDTLNLSASQIDKQAECRMSYFLNYGLRAKERKEAAVDPAEFGTYVHAVLENTARCIRDMGGFRKVSLEQTIEIAHQFSEEYARERFAQIESERIIYLFRRNLRELDMVVAELWEELQESQFDPKDFEVEFGKADGLPPIAIENSGMNAILRGFVDRVDTWQSPGSLYYRVVDYKTGKKDFDYCDVYNGVGLQMLLYLFALRNNSEAMFGTTAFPAGVQYFPARVPYLPSDGALSDQEADAKREKEWKRKGLLLNDEAVLEAMEPLEHVKRLCCTVKRDGTISGDLADRDQMRLLETFVFRVVGKLVEDIASGNVEPNPYSRGSSHDACRFCPFGDVCHGGQTENRRNYKMMSAQRFWEEVEKEVAPNGR